MMFVLRKASLIAENEKLSLLWREHVSQNRPQPWPLLPPAGETNTARTARGDKLTTAIQRTLADKSTSSGSRRTSPVTRSGTDGGSRLKTLSEERATVRYDRRKIGGGGMGAVYLAYDNNSSRRTFRQGMVHSSMMRTQRKAIAISSASR